MINRKHTDGRHNTVEVGMPGFVGTLTGMNEKGLSLSMNVCRGDTSQIRGMPASLYNRSCLERCASVAEVDDLVARQSPLGPYHMTVADPNRAKSIHFYQGPDHEHIKRPLQDTRPLSTLNFRYNPCCSSDVHHSTERQRELDQFFANREGRPLEEALSLPFVNNWLTTHRVVMEPRNCTMRVAFDNAFAGNAPLHTIPLEKLFQRAC